MLRLNQGLCSDFFFFGEKNSLFKNFFRKNPKQHGQGNFLESFKKKKMATFRKFSFSFFEIAKIFQGIGQILALFFPF